MLIRYASNHRGDSAVGLTETAARLHYSAQTLDFAQFCVKHYGRFRRKDDIQRAGSACTARRECLHWPSQQEFA
jgi:hypothetical protein